MHEPYRRKQCPECRYRLMALANFDGASSAGAPGFHHRDASDYRAWGWLSIAWDLVEPLSQEIRLLRRRRQVRRLQATILLTHPHTMICPHCLFLDKRN